MAGTDTARGINFQYASAIRMLLSFPEHPEWYIIQFEGDLDIEDALVLNFEGQAVFRAQFKQKIDPQRWEPSEWNAVLEAFANTQNPGEAYFSFVYAGSRGPAVVKLDAVLQNLRQAPVVPLSDEDNDLLNVHLSAKSRDFVIATGERLVFEHQESWESIQARDWRRLRRLLVAHNAQRPSEGLEEDIYNRLFVTIARKTETSSRYLRQLTRKEVYQLIGFADDQVAAPTFDVAAYRVWLAEHAKQISPIIPLDLLRESSAPAILNMVIRPEHRVDQTLSEALTNSLTQPLSSLATLSIYHRIMMVGLAGSGKSTLLFQLGQHFAEKANDIDGQAKSALLPIYINLAGYDGESMPALIQDALQSSGQAVTAEAVDALIATEPLLLLLDDFDLAKTDQLAPLTFQLRKWLFTHPQFWAVTTSHRATDGHNLNLATFRLQSLTSDQQRAILTGLKGIEKADVTVICNGLPSESAHLLEQPLTLQMLAYAYLQAGHRVPYSLAGLYQDVVTGLLTMNEQKGFNNIPRSDKVSALSALAAWMQNTEIYTVSPTRLGNLLGEWINAIDNPYKLAPLAGYSLMELRQALMQSNLLTVDLEEGLTFIHPTFRNFLAALALVDRDIREVYSKRSWQTSLIFLASLGTPQQINALLESLVENPVLLGKLIQERAVRRASIQRDKAQIKVYFDAFARAYFTLAKRFPSVLKMSPWREISEDKARLAVYRSTDAGYTVICSIGEANSELVEWIDDERLQVLSREFASTLPLPMWLLPASVVERYLPSELAYLWVVRSLFDLIEFFGWFSESHYATSQADSQSYPHPAVKSIIERYMLLQQIVDGLPEDLRAELPYYAQREFDLFIEVDETHTPPSVRHVARPGGESGKIRVVANVHKEVDTDPPMLIRDDMSWTVNYANTIESIVGVEEDALPEVWAGSPDRWVKRLLKDHLQSLLPGFPPHSW